MVKFKHLFCILFLICCFSFPGFGQIKFSGQLHSSLNSWETSAQNQQTDFYQGLQLMITPEKYTNLSLSSYLRFARRGDPVDWNNRAYNMFLKWNSNNRRYQIRGGRQFIYSGVINGTIDGLLISIKPINRLHIKMVGGLEATQERDFGIRKWSEGNVLGGYVSYRFLSQTKVEMSYFQKERSEKTVWQLGGFALNGKFKENMYYQATLDYNFKTSEIQGQRYRLSYYKTNWNFMAEYNSQKPRIHEDSYFKIFKIYAYDQVRTGVYYQLKSYQLGILYLFTAFESDNNNELQFTIGSDWGIAGFLFQNGFGGDNSGVYGEIRYPISPNITLRLFSSYYNYQRHTLDISENAIAFSGGIEYRPQKQFIVQAELQESKNSYFENDLRGLIRLIYSFHQ